jgi:hypothetical protein
MSRAAPALGAGPVAEGFECPSRGDLWELVRERIRIPREQVACANRIGMGCSMSPLLVQWPAV